MRFTLAVLLFVSSIRLMGQQPNEKMQYTTKTQEFLASKDTFIEKEYIDFGNIDEIDVRCVKIKNLLSGKTYVALRLEMQYTGKILSAGKSVFVDMDEIDGLMKNIKLLQQTTLKKKPANYTETTLKCRSGMVFGCVYNTEERKWLTYIQLLELDSKTIIFIENDGFQYFYNLLDKATSYF